MDVFREWIRLPLVMWIYGLDGCQRAMRGVRAPAGEPPPGPAPFDRPAPTTPRTPAPSSRPWEPPVPRTAGNPANPTTPQEVAVDDRNLSDDMVKLVTYDIVSIARDAERIIHSDSVMVTDNTSGEAFSSWMIARYLQASPTPIEEAERKYLRVYYRVQERWPKQSLRYEERQLATLEGIERAIRETQSPKQES